MHVVCRWVSLVCLAGVFLCLRRGWVLCGDMGAWCLSLMESMVNIGVKKRCVGRWCKEGLDWPWLVLVGESLFGEWCFCWCFCLIIVWLFIFIFMACIGEFVGGISGFRVVSIALFTWCFVVVCGWTALGVRPIKQSTILCKVSPGLLQRGHSEKPHTQNAEHLYCYAVVFVTLGLLCRNAPLSQVNHD